MKNNYDMELKKILKNAENEMFELHHPYVGSEHLMLAILKSKTNSRYVLNKYGLDYDTFRNNLINIVGMAKKKSEIALYTPLLKRIISEAENDASESGNIVKTENILLSMLEEGEGICIRILINMDIDLESLYSELKNNVISLNKNKDLLVYDIGKLMKPTNEIIYKRDNEIKTLIEILLRKNKNNPLLIGEAGVGKTAIVEELVRRIENGLVPEFLENYKVIELDTGSLISGTRYRGDFEDRLNKIIKEIIEEKNIILFIDEIHTLVNCGGAEGAIDAANILKPYLARGDIKVIGATTLKEYRETIEKDKALDRRFQIINVDEPSIKDTEYILMHIKENYEKHHNVIITEENIKDIVNLSNKYIFNKYNPDKSLDILDSVCAHVQLSRPKNKDTINNLFKKKENMLKEKKYKEALETEIKIKDIKSNKEKIKITKEDILKVVEYRANMPLQDDLKDRINNLNTTLKENIIGQSKQIDELSNLIKQKYLCNTLKPLEILITGPSGVGKTYTGEVLANTLFGPNHFIRLDMSEFKTSESISKLIGTTQGYIGYDDDAILDKIKDYPYSVVLLDEIEIAHSSIIKLFTHIFDEGYTTNGKGETIHFENVTFILTSNKVSTSNIGFTNKKSSKPNISNELTKYISKTIEYDRITKEDAKKYIKRECHNIKLTNSEINKIIKNANIEEFGIRGLQKELNKLKIGKLLTKV